MLSAEYHATETVLMVELHPELRSIGRVHVNVIRRIEVGPHPIAGVNTRYFIFCNHIAGSFAGGKVGAFELDVAVEVAFFEINHAGAQRFESIVITGLF